MPPLLRDVLTSVFASYETERRGPLKGNLFARQFREDATKAISAIVERLDLHIEASVGQGNWADVPWIGIFNPESTNSARSGVYVVYLFSRDLRSVYLCQGQGVTRVKEEFGRAQLAELSRRAQLMQSRVPEFNTRFAKGPIELGGTTALAKSYDGAVAYFRKYDATSLPPADELDSDLTEMVRAYDLLLARGGTDNVETAMLVSGADEASGGSRTIDEERRYTRHLRIERKSTDKVKETLGHVCQVCGFDFAIHYGALGKNFIEAHHLTPLYSLPEGVVVSMNPHTDFAVLCANCHRMLHRKRNETLSLADLRQLVEVGRLRKLLGAHD